MELATALQAVSESSMTLAGWALSILGASVAAIVSTSYLRPEDLRIRRLYLLYLPGWLALGLSVLFGVRVSGGSIGAQLVGDPSRVEAIVRGISHDAAHQQDAFTAGLACFSVWLVVFLVWWVYSPSASNRRK